MRMATSLRNTLKPKIIIIEWIRHFNETRSHSGLGYLTQSAWKAQQILEISA